MGSHKKHKKHKSERRERYEDQPFCLEKPPSLKLILKVGNASSTPEYGSSDQSPSVYGGVQPESLGLLVDYPERHKKSKKKKKKKDREKKHKHHKEKRRHRDESRERTENEVDESTQDDFSINEDSAQFQSDSTMKYQIFSDSMSPASIIIPRTPLMSLPMKSPISIDPLMSEQSPSMSISSVRSDSLKSPSSTSDSGREARNCALKVRQKALSKLLNHLLSILEKKDTNQFFAWPVSDDIAPGYSSIISRPMDFFTMRSKIEENKYNSLPEFVDDFKLIGMNATQYNNEETIYYKAAKKLLNIGEKVLKPENLLRLRPLQVFMQEMSPIELGFDMTHAHHYNESHINDSGDEGMSAGAEEVNLAQLEEEVKRQNIRSENEPNTRFDPYIDDLTAEEVLDQVKNAAAKAQKALSARRKAAKMGFLRQKKNGTTSMQILVDIENSCPERVVSIGTLAGKLQNGTGQLHGFREDRRNNAKIVKPLNYGTFCSFAPIYDSRFSSLSMEESQLVIDTYGDDTGSEYAASILEFTKDSQQGNALANGLLDFLTQGEHRKTMAVLTENYRQKYETNELERTFPNPPNEDDEEKLKDVAIDFDSLRSLGDLGLNVDFLNVMEDDYKTYEIFKSLQGKLENNTQLIERLNQVQNDRLSHNLPLHLANVAHPDEDELDLANQITTNLKEISKELPPNAIVSVQALRKAMGISNIGLEPINGYQESNKTRSPLDNNELTTIDANDSVLPMDIDSEHHSDEHSTNDPTSVTQVDLENELRAFLESDTGLSAADDVNSIDQMLMV